MKRTCAVVVRGKRAAVVLGGPERFTVYSQGCGPDRHLPPGMDRTTWTGTMASLAQQVDEARADNWLTFYEHRLLRDALKEAHVNSEAMDATRVLRRLDKLEAEHPL